MIRKLLSLCAGLCLSTALLSSCSEQESQAPSSGKLQMLTTTTYLADLAKEIAGDKLEIKNLCGPGVDPHTYVATLQNVQDMEEANIIVYNGVGLEAQLSKVLDKLKKQGSHIICAEDGIKPEQFLSFDEEGTIVKDPHIWNDVTLWQAVAKEFTTKLCQYDPAHADFYQANYERYIKELDELTQYVDARLQEVPKESRILITVHDAFEYMAHAYSIEVNALQGLSTATEAGTKDISDLASMIAERNIKAVFLENTASPQSVKALQAAVKSKGGDVQLGGELYSDALGDKASGCDTYIKVIKGNIDTIVDALK